MLRTEAPLKPLAANVSRKAGAAVASVEQRYGWDAERARFWLAHLAAMEAPLIPVAAAIFSVVDLKPGERVLDVGCGAGATTIEAADRVGPEGRVCGIDISPEMIDAARERSAAPNLEWVVADAVEYDLPMEGFDAIISRFGIMFFSFPERAFRRLNAACRQGGRLVAAVWRHRDRAPYFALPYDILTSVLDRRRAVYTPIPADQGPFSLGDERQTIDLLVGAGWVDVHCSLRRDPLYLRGPATLEQAVEALIESNSEQGVLVGQPGEIIEEARAALTEGLGRWHDGTGISLPGGFLMITATRD
jgi:SAM-dependent methyltransferase